MDNEPYRDLTHHQAADLVAAFVNECRDTAWREFALPSSKIADVFIRRQNGDVEIVEVKMVLKAALIGDAFLKYGHWCHRLWVAVPSLTLDELDRLFILPQWPARIDRVGILGVHLDQTIVLRQATRQAMTGELYQMVHAAIPTA